MKLIHAIVSSDDSNKVSEMLMQDGFFATKLATTGGFLKTGNTTFLICTEEENVDRAIAIISEHCKKRKQTVVANPYIGMQGHTPYPIEVTVGGATIIVTDVERFEKV